MEQRTQQRMARAGMGASLVAALAASICCLGPVLAVTLGVSSLATFARYEPLRPFFSILTVVVLLAAFYFTYRKRTVDPCATDSFCSTDGGESVQRVNRAILWIVAAITAVILTFPAWSGWVLP